MRISVGYSAYLVYLFLLYNYERFKRFRTVKIALRLLPKAIFFLCLILAIMPVESFAADATWDGSESGLWVTGGNWEGDTAPGGVGTTDNTDTATFTGDTNTTVTVDDTRNVQDITFDASAGAFTLSGDTLYLSDAGTVQNEAGTSNTQTIDSDIILVGDYTFTNNATDNAKLINFDGTITGTTDITQALTLSGANTGSNTISGIISDGGGAGVLGITKSGAGTWVLSGTNTYTGTTTISAGTLELSGGSAIADAGAVSLDNIASAVLKLNANETIGSLSGGGATGGNVNLQSFTLTTGGNDASGTYAGAISGTGGLTKAGSGTLILSGANTYTGKTTINEGRLKIDAESRLGGNPASFTADQLTLNGGILQTTETFSFDTNRGITLGASGGTLDQDAATTLTAGSIISGTGGLTKAGSGTLILSGENTYSDGTTLTSGTIIIANDDALGTSDLTLAGTGTLQSNDNARIVTNDIDIDANDLTISGAYDLELNGDISDTTGGGTLTVNMTAANDTLTLSGANTYTGLTTVSAGTLTLSGGSAIADTADITVAGGTLDVSDAETVADVTLSSGTISGAGVLTADSYAITNEGTISADLAGIGATLTKTGAGTATLSGTNNTYTGATTVNAGTLNLNEGLATSSLVFSGDGTVNLAAGKDIEGTVTNSSGATTGTLNYLGSSTTYNNVGGTTAGTDDLTAVNITDGTLTLGHNIYATTTTVSTGATVDFGSNNLTIGGTFNMLGASVLDLDILDKDTSGSLTTTGAADIPGTVDIDLDITSGQYIPHGTTYTIVDGTGGTDVDGGNDVIDTNPYVSFTTEGGADLTLVASRSGTGFDSWATTGNSRAAGVALEDAGSNNPSSDMLSVLGEMEALSTSQVESALTQMIPQIDRSVIDASNAVSLHSIQTMTDHLHYNRTGGASGVSTGDSLTTKDVWVKGFGTREVQDARDGIEGYRADVLGAGIGADVFVTGNATLGLGIEYANTRVKAKKSNIGTNEIDTLQGSIYYGYDRALNHIPGDMLYLNLIGSFGWNTYDASRSVSFGSINRTAKASYDGQQYTMYAETGYHVPLSSTIDWIPFFSLRYTRLNLDSYTETEADSLNLDVDKQAYNMCELGLGMKLVSKIRTENFDFMPEIRAQWLYDVVADNMETTSRFSGGGASFKTTGAKPSKSMFDLGGSLTFITSKNVTVDFDYDYSFRSDYSANDASAVLKFGMLLP
jgi:autotransporter-associated beta strand protein